MACTPKQTRPQRIGGSSSAHSTTAIGHHHHHQTRSGRALVRVCIVPLVPLITRCHQSPAVKPSRLICCRCPLAHLAGTQAAQKEWTVSDSIRAAVCSAARSQAEQMPKQSKEEGRAAAAPRGKLVLPFPNRPLVPSPNPVQPNALQAEA